MGGLLNTKVDIPRGCLSTFQPGCFMFCYLKVIFFAFYTVKRLAVSLVWRLFLSPPQVLRSSAKEKAVAQFWWFNVLDQQQGSNNTSVKKWTCRNSQLLTINWATGEDQSQGNHWNSCCLSSLGKVTAFYNKSTGETWKGARKIGAKSWTLVGRVIMFLTRAVKIKTFMCYKSRFFFFFCDS